MSCAKFTNSVMDDDWTVSFDKVPQTADKADAVARLKRGWDSVYPQLNGLFGLTLTKPDLEMLIDALTKANTHAVMFTLVLTTNDMHVELEAGKLTLIIGKVAVPSELEPYRNFLTHLHRWSAGGHDIVTDSDLQKYNKDNPPLPAKYKDFDEMTKKNVPADVAAFRTWAKAKKKAALDEIDKTAKAKATDPKRVAALKGINAALTEYQKSF